MNNLTKAQKAAKAWIRHQLNEIIIGIKIDKLLYTVESIQDILQKIDETIKEYNLNDDFINDYVEEVYITLYNARRYLDAAIIAKKYKL